jgi:hypothetical protein
MTSSTKSIEIIKSMNKGESCMTRQKNDNLGKHIDEDKRYSRLYASNECLSTNNLIGKRNSR